MQANSLRRSLVALALLLAPLSWAQAPSPVPRVVIKGYDPVAYFTQQKAVLGSADISYNWDDGWYYFSNEKNRDMFAADPDRYAPRFAGYCTGALLSGDRFEPDPRIWAIIDGKLYLFGSATTREAVVRNPASLAVAQRHWETRR
jgi:YHS domain-containing protein